MLEEMRSYSPSCDKYGPIFLRQCRRILDYVIITVFLINSMIGNCNFLAYLLVDMLVLVIRLHAIILLVHVVRVVAAILEVTAIRIIIAHNYSPGHLACGKSGGNQRSRPMATENNI